MIKQRKRQLRQIHRFNEFFAGVEQNLRRAHHEIPVYFLVKIGFRQAHIVPKSKAHFRFTAAPTCSPEPLDKPRNRERTARLDNPLQLSEVNSQLQRNGCTSADGQLAVFHTFLGKLAQRGGNVRVVHEITPAVVIFLGNCLDVRNVFLDLALAVGEQNAAFSARALVEIIVIILQKRFAVAVRDFLGNGEKPHGQPNLSALIRTFRH